MQQKTLKIATRTSALARCQAELVADAVKAAAPGLVVEFLYLKTEGDRRLDVSLTDIGGKGLFVKELEHALLNGDADIAVHSAKDMPAELPVGLELPVVLERADPRDVLVSRSAAFFSDLPAGAVIGTSSLRREAQLKNLRPDLVFKSIRGNVQTRLSKLERGEFDAIALAAAGLKRLALEAKITEIFSPDDLLPAIGQGTIVIESRADDQKTRALIDAIHDHSTATLLQAERALGFALGANCEVPVAGFAQFLENNKLKLTGRVFWPEKNKIYHAQMDGSSQEPEELGRQVGDELIAQGALEAIEALRRSRS